MGERIEKMKLFEKETGQPNATGTEQQPEGQSEVTNPESGTTGEEQPTNLTDEQKQLNEYETQSKEENARFARERREKERQQEIAKAKEEARVNTIIEAVGVNPYTNEEIKDADDVDSYLLMKRIEKEGGDPVADYAKYQKKYHKEKAEKEQTARASEEQTRKDVESFQTAHPDVKVTELFKDDDFKIFAKGKLGNIPLTEIYTDYQAYSSKYRKMTEDEKVAAKQEADRKAAEALARGKSTPGSLSSTTTPDGAYFTAEQIEKMSVKEIQANLEKVNKSIEHNKKRK